MQTKLYGDSCKELEQANTRLTNMTLTELSEETWVLAGSYDMELIVDHDGVKGELSLEFEQSSVDKLEFLANLLTAKARYLAEKIEMCDVIMTPDTMDADIDAHAEILCDEYGFEEVEVNHDLQTVAIRVRRVDAELLEANFDDYIVEILD